eukprot:1176288-Prorocentrum_minimum.AAC.3
MCDVSGLDWAQATGTKIALRGKGAVKEGKPTLRKDGKEQEGAGEELHVYITGETLEAVESAVELITPLLTPVDDDMLAVHKAKQVRHLARPPGEATWRGHLAAPRPGGRRDARHPQGQAGAPPGEATWQRKFETPPELGGLAPDGRNLPHIMTEEVYPARARRVVSG